MRELLLEQFQDRKEQVEKFCDYFFDEKPVDGLDFEVAATIAMFLCRQLNAIVENSACTGFLIIQDGLFSDSNSKLNQGLNQLEFLRKTYSNKEYLAKLKQIYPCTPPQNKFAAEQNLFMVFGLIFEAEMFAKRDRYLFGNLMMQAKKYLENVADFFDKTRQDFFKGLQLFIDYELAQNALCPDEGQQKILDNENLKFRCGVDLYTLATIKERLDLDKISKKDAQNLKRNNPAKYVAMQNLRAIRADKIDDPAKYYEVFFKILCEQGEDLTDQENKDAMVEQYQNYCKSVDVAPLSVGSFAAQMLYCSVILARKVQNNLRYFEQERDKIYTLFSAQNEQPSEVAKFCLDTMISLHQSAGKIDAIDAAIDLISNLKDKFFLRPLFEVIMIEIKLKDPRHHTSLIPDTFALLKRKSENADYVLMMNLVAAGGDMESFAMAMQDQSFAAYVEDAATKDSEDDLQMQFCMAKNLSRYYLDEISVFGNSKQRTDLFYQKFKKLIEAQIKMKSADSFLEHLQRQYSDSEARDDLYSPVNCNLRDRHIGVFVKMLQSSMNHEISPSARSSSGAPLSGSINVRDLH